MFVFALHTILFISACIVGTLGSVIVTFTDGECKKSFNDLDTVNGYPDGLCKPLGITGKLAAFQISELDPGCKGTCRYSPIHVQV